MTNANVIQSNFASGELSPKVRGRFDLKIYQNGLEIMENFIPEIQGAARFRTGTRYIHHTRLNQHAVLIPFQFNDEQAYIVEFTNGKIRFYKDAGAIVEASVTISGATQADPVVITATAHGYSNGDEVFLNSVGGMTELDVRYFLVANQNANTFELTNIDGTDIDGTGYTAYTSGGTSEKIYEIVSPYHEGDLYDLKYAQNADVMYITDPHGNDVRKLTRTAHNAWSLSTFSRTSDKHPSKVITGATQADPCVVTATAHGFEDGEIVSIHDIVGMIEINHAKFLVSNKTANTFEIQDLTGVDIDSTGFTAYSSGGTVGDPPQSVAFYEGRIIYGGSFNKPQTFWGSKAPDPTTGEPRYDDFTIGTDADDAFAFTLAPSITGEVDHIEWLAGTVNFLVLGTFGGLTKVSGGGINKPITPTSISAKPVTDDGAASIVPISKGTSILYAQRGSRNIRSFEYDVLTDDFVSIDRNLVADHMFQDSSFIKQITFSKGTPDILWAVRDDGILAGVSYKSKEDVSGWHRQIIGGTHPNFVVGTGTTKPKVLSVASISRPNNVDQTYVVVERIIGLGSGLTRRYVEFFIDEPEIPELDQFYSGAGNEVVDTTTYENAMFEAQKNYIHLDCSLSFDGSIFGVQASASMAIAATTGTDIALTAGAAFFNASDDVGRQIWKKTIGGFGEGMAVITSVTDSTNAVCDILEDFDNTVTMPAGDWYITRSAVDSGLDHLEGADVTVVADGKVLSSTKTVLNGGFSLGLQASVFHLGFNYTGLLKSMNVEVGGVTGVAQTKQRNVEKAVIRFLNTLNVKVGTNRYRLEDAPFE